MRSILLDTNILIKIIKDPKEQEAMQLLNLLEEGALIYTTPLIKHEVLRFYKQKDHEQEYQKAVNLLKMLKNLDINQHIGDLATEIVRFERQKYPERYDTQVNGKTKNINKYNFDIFHVATAKHHQLELESNDEDVFSRIEDLYNEMKNEMQQKS